MINKPTIAMMATLLLAACGRSPATTALVPQAADPVVSNPEPPRFETDESLEADAEALEALRELEFGSLEPGSGHIGGAVPVLNTDVEPLNHPGGGAAAGPRYDLNIEPFADHTRVQYYVDYFLGPAKNRFGIWLTRLPRYEGMIRSVFRQYGVPQDMVYLGIVESGYSNSAVSWASAVGMWQFMSYTGRAFGLRIDSWVDERRDPFKATDAAARYLANLHQRFGSWYLAAAAYNGGEGRVGRGIRRLGHSEIGDETFFDLAERRYIRSETRDYVPKLIAATMIAKSPEQYGFDPVGESNPLVFDEIRVVGTTGLDVIARLADTTNAAILELNPHYYRGVTPPGEEAVVRVPHGSGPEVIARYDELPESERVNFVEHRVRRGETLGEIAGRYNVSLNLVMAANTGIEPRRLRVDQRIVIPVSEAARRGGANPIHIPSARSARPTYHTVRSGESLSIIARRYRTTVSALQRLNGIENSSVIRVGERLMVRATPSGIHTVQRGESLWVIARRYGRTVAELRRWNQLQNGSIIRVGQRLRITPS